MRRTFILINVLMIVGIILQHIPLASDVLVAVSQAPQTAQVITTPVDNTTSAPPDQSRQVAADEPKSTHTVVRGTNLAKKNSSWFSRIFSKLGVSCSIGTCIRSK